MAINCSDDESGNSEKASLGRVPRRSALSGCALAAAIIPARRAASISPIRALRAN
jgi:hypothetical protein